MIENLSIEHFQNLCFIESLSQLFIKSSIVADLLRIVDSGRKSVVRKNAGIALAKLSQSDSR